MSGNVPNATIGNGGLEQQRPAALDARLMQLLGGQVRALEHAYDGRGLQAVQPSYDNRAILRALRLLWQHLTPEQRAQYKLYSHNIDHEGRSFIVRGNRSGHHYRIFENGSVIRLKDHHRFCLVMVETVPPADMMLAKKLLLEHDEGLFLEVANDLTSRHALPDGREILERMARRVAPPLPPRAERRPPEPPTTMARRGRAFWNRWR